MNSSAPQAQEIDERPLGFILNALRGDLKRLCLLSLLLIVLSQVLDTMVPLCIKWMVNAADEINRQTRQFGDLWRHFALLSAVFFGALLAARGYQSMNGLLAPALKRRIEQIYTSFVLSQPPAYFDRISRGTLAQYSVQIPRSVSSILEILYADMARLLVMVVAATVMISLQSVGLGLGVLAWALVYIGLAIKTAKRTRELASEAARASARTTSEMLDVISNIGSVFAFATAQFEERMMEATFFDEYSAAARLRKHVTQVRLLQAALAMTCILVVMATTVYRYAAGRLSIGDLSMMFGISTLMCMMIWQSTGRIVDLFEQVGFLAGALNALKKPLDSLVAPAGRVELKLRGGAIEFHQVTFRYDGGGEVFRDFNWRIEAGERVGVAGPSGSGKTTLVRLLCRHYELNGGFISIDGTDIATVDPVSLNLQIAEVGQTPKLFSRSVEENIRYGRREAPHEDVVKAAKRANCHEFIASRPEGYRSPAGDEGHCFSVGEKQRIAIARALLKDSRIVILDEATSALDAESEALVQDSLAALTSGRTVIAIAHRLTTLRTMDRIIWLDHGRVVETGTHRELLAAGGAYARAWALQNGMPDDLSLSAAAADSDAGRQQI